MRQFKIVINDKDSIYDVGSSLHEHMKTCPLPYTIEEVNEDNPVPSLEHDFTTDNHQLYIKSSRDTRKHTRWELVKSLHWMTNGNYWLCKTDRFGYEKFSHCEIKQNGVETDKELPNFNILKNMSIEEVEVEEEWKSKTDDTIVKIKLAINDHFHLVLYPNDTYKIEQYNSILS